MVFMNPSEGQLFLEGLHHPVVATHDTWWGSELSLPGVTSTWVPYLPLKDLSTKKREKVGELGGGW